MVDILSDRDMQKSNKHDPMSRTRIRTISITEQQKIKMFKL